MTKINRTVLMSDARFFGDSDAINAYMDNTVPVDTGQAMADHTRIKAALESTGISVQSTASPEGCQDGVYTANWALCRGNKAVMAALPNKRQAEEPYAETVLRELGKTIIKVPEGLRFSGQGDALPCGNLLFAGSTYRTDAAVHDFLADTLGYEVISLETIPALDDKNLPVINQVTGWPDSFFYDIDLALSVLSPGLIAWCPEAFTPLSRTRIRSLNQLEKIEVSLDEAIQGLACNLISTGETVVMSSNAPKLKAAIESRGLHTITPDIDELDKGGGYIRCCGLTLDND